MTAPIILAHRGAWGPDAPEKNLALRRATGNEPEDVEAYLRSMVEQGRLIYEFSDIRRTYGRY